MRERTAVLEGGPQGGAAGPVHVVEYGGEGPPIVLVHGLGGSHVNWVTVAEELTAFGRVSAIDLIGFGRTVPAGRESSIVNNRELLVRYLEQEVGEPAIVFGNSMGGFVSMLAARKAPHLVRGMVLVAPALPLGRYRRPDPRISLFFLLYLIPGVAEPALRWRNQRLGAERMVDTVLRLCTVDVDRIPDEAYEAHVEFARERLRMPWGNEAFLESARSLLRFLARRDRFEDRIRAVDVPVLVVAGEEDRLVPAGAARRLAEVRPDWQVEVLDDLGHVPQLEDPDRFLEVVRPWLANLNATKVA